MSRHAFTLTPTEAEALLDLVEESLAHEVRTSLVPMPHRQALGRIRSGLRTVLRGRCGAVQAKAMARRFFSGESFAAIAESVGRTPEQVENAVRSVPVPRSVGHVREVRL